MRTLHISVLDKKAAYLSRDGDIVCGNSDYVIEFAFDAEWDAHTEKVARFIWNGDYKDVEFTGNTCRVPMVTNTSEIKVGVYAGDLCTTTPAVIACQRSILCGSVAESDVPVIASNIYIRYSAYADGRDFTETWSNNQRYIGIAAGRSAPADPSGYAWSLFTSGTVIHQAHIRYSAFPDGTDFTDHWSAGLIYMGIAVGATAPTDKREYEWMRIASNIRQTETVTLSADGWVSNKQTVSIPFIGEESSAFASPVAESMAEYIENGIMLDSITSRSLTFSCVSAPSTDIMVEVDITEPLVKSAIGDGEQPTGSKFVMRDAAGNLSAVNVEHPEYPNLIYRYEHTSNKEVHPTAVDLETGVWTAEGHGLTNNQTVYVVVNAPYHLNKPYQYLPGGLKIGSDNGKGQFAKKYYATVVDENTFTLSESSGGAAVTFTEVSTMDLSKFHFEPHVWTDITISNLPNSTELLFVLKGRMINGARYLQINNSGMAGAVGLDNDTYVWVGGSNAALYLGSTGGWGSMYLTAEIKFIEEKHVLMSVTQDTMSYTPANSDYSSVVQHVRRYVHHYMWNDYFNTIKLHMDSMLANGTALEVYSK